MIRCRILQAPFLSPHFLCFPALTPTVSANIWVLYFSVSSQISSHPYQKNRRCSASIRGENWHIIDGLLLWVYCETWLHLHLLHMINVMEVSRDSFEMFLFCLTTLPLTELHAAAWLEDLLTDNSDWGFGRSQHRCFDKVVGIYLEGLTFLHENPFLCFCLPY